MKYYIPGIIIFGGLALLMVGSILGWKDPGHEPPPLPEPVIIHDTIYIERIIYDTLFVIDKGDGWGYLSDTPY